MNTKKYQITVSGNSIDVVRKAVKNLHLAVYPPNGRIRVTVPTLMSDEAVRMVIISRLTWIKRQQARFVDQDRQSEREYITGESHSYLGQRYQLNVKYENGSPHVEVRNRNTIDLYVPGKSDKTRRRIVLREWYRKQLKAMIPDLIKKWESIIGVDIADWGVKRMKTRWGSCNIQARRIWLNLELVKKPVQCLEYIIVHEMVHLLERNHTERFTTLLDEFLPKWREAKSFLGQHPLTFEWDY